MANSSAISSKIKVIGVGGAGCSAINRMIKSKIPMVQYVAINTDIQSLKMIGAGPVKKIQIGKSLTSGSGTGMNPDIGRAAIEESAVKIRESLKGADIIFITAGLGGGVGSGAGPVIAELSQKTKALTIAILTKPFSFEGVRRMAIAEEAIKKFTNRVDAVITISNDRITNVINRSTPILKAFHIADEALEQGVQSISDILFKQGLINLDFSDVRTILKQAGSTILSVGASSGDGRAVRAAKICLKNPLIEGLSISGATGVLFVINGSSDLKMSEVNEISEIVVEEVDKGAKIIFGVVIDEKLKDELKITLIATGFDNLSVQRSRSESSTDTLADNSFNSGDFSVSEIGDNKDNKNRDQGRKELRHEVHAYGLDIEDREENIIQKDTKEVKLEDDLDIPTFLRKRLE